MQLALEIGGFLLTLAVIIGGLWNHIDKTFVRKESDDDRRAATKELEEERSKRLDDRFSTLERKFDEMIAESRRTASIVQTELPNAVREACIYGAGEMFKLLNDEDGPLISIKRRRGES